MELIQYVTIGLAVSGPLTILVGIGRVVLSLVRSLRSRQVKFAVYALLSILGLLTLLGVVLTAWFGYGVAHTGKDASTDAIVLFATLVPVYLSVYGVWRLSRHIEKKIKLHAF